MWKKEDEGWATSFCRYWRKPHPVVDFPNKSKQPHELLLGTDVRFSPPVGNQILVTQAYERMFHRLLTIRGEDSGTTKGAVVTGQPGTGASVTRFPPCAATHRWIKSAGKTTFLTFMLVQLVSAHQVVIYCTPKECFLFYRGEVYTRSTKSGFENLPSGPGVSYCPVWALIDMDFKNKAPPIVRESNIWPIQASSQKPIQWESWLNQTGGALLGLPLWSMEELMIGYAFPLFPLATSPGHAA